VFQLEVTDPSEDEMYAFLQGYGSLYNHSNFPSVDYRLPHQPVDPANTVSHVVEFVARRDIMKGAQAQRFACPAWVYLFAWLFAFVQNIIEMQNVADESGMN